MQHVIFLKFFDRLWKFSDWLSFLLDWQFDRLSRLIHQVSINSLLMLLMHTPWSHLVRIMILLQSLPDQRQSNRSLLWLLTSKILFLPSGQTSVRNHLRFGDFKCY